MSNPFASGQYGGGGNQPVPQPGVDLTSQIVNTVKQDMESGEKSGQWISLATGSACVPVPTTGVNMPLFLSPAKDCVSVPGMEDVSPEELRSVSVRYCETSVSILLLPDWRPMLPRPVVP